MLARDLSRVGFTRSVTGKYPQEHAGQGGTSGCAAVVLLLVLPFFLISLSLLFGGELAIGLSMTLVTGPLVYWMINLIRQPITRRVVYVDPAGMVGMQQFRKRGKPSENEVAVPREARVVLREAAVQGRMSWNLELKNEASTLWTFDPPKDREQAEQLGRQIAQTLSVPFEVKSDFER